MGLWGSLVAFELWEFATPVQIWVAPFYIMPRTKKVKSAGRFGVGYGKRVRTKLLKIESKQRKKQICPFCKKEKKLKRLATGIWKCNYCGKKFASDAYYIE